MISLSLKTGFKLSKFRVSILWKPLENLYIIWFSIRSLVSLTLQCTYLSLQKSLNNESNPKTRISIIDEINTVRGYMLKAGQIYRHMGTTAVFCYSIFFFGAIFLYLVKLFTKGRVFNYIENNDLIEFLIKPRTNHHRISRNIHNILEQLIESNVNFTRNILSRSRVKSNRVKYNFKRNIAEEEPDKEFICGGTDLYRSIPSAMSSLKVDIPQEAINNNPALVRRTFVTQYMLVKPVASESYLAKSQMIDSLFKQFQYLRLLNSNKYLIWPPNRNHDWEKKIKRWWLVFYTTSYILVWFFSQSATMVGRDVATKALQTSKLDKVERLKGFTIWDEISFADTQIFVGLAVEWFIVPLSVMTACIRDQVKFLALIELKMHQFYNKITKLEGLFEFNHGLSTNTQIEAKIDPDINEAQRELQFECDKDALALYVDWSLCQIQIKSSVKLMQRAVGQSVLFMFCSLIVTLFYFDSLTKDQLVFVIYVVIIVMTTVNAGLFFCAKMDTCCRRIFKLSWTLIGVVESHTTRQFLKSHHHLEEEQQNGSSTEGCYSETIYRNLSRKSDLEYYSHSPITPHTLMIWRRLVENHEFISGKLDFADIHYDFL